MHEIQDLLHNNKKNREPIYVSAVVVVRSLTVAALTKRKFVVHAGWVMIDAPVGNVPPHILTGVLNDDHPSCVEWATDTYCHDRQDFNVWKKTKKLKKNEI